MTANIESIPTIVAPAPAKVLILRTCGKGFLAYNDFQWPREVGAIVRPTSWNPSDCCGYGLHGLLKGEGKGSLVDWTAEAEWLVIEADADSVVSIDRGEKVKVPVCTIAHIGRGTNAVEKRLDCLAFMAARGQLGEAPIGRVAQDMRDGSTLTGGDRSTLTGGDGSTLTGGYGSTLTGGHGSTLTGGYGSTLTGGYRSTLTGGDRSTLTGGDRSTLTGGDRSTLTGGYRSTLTGGYGSTLTGGDRSTLVFQWYDASEGRYRRKLVEVGFDGVEKGIAYKLNDAGILVRA